MYRDFRVNPVNLTKPSRLLNGKAGVSANMALALEDIGWGTADHWMRMQASYELAQARQERADARRQAELRFV